MKILSDLRVNRFATMSTEGSNNPRDNNSKGEAPWPSEQLSQGAGGQEAPRSPAARAHWAPEGGGRCDINRK